jgi:hypothetical protein
MPTFWKTDMNSSNNYKLPEIWIAIVILLQPLGAAAGIHSQSFTNGFQTDAIYLFLYDTQPSHDVIFEQVTFNSAEWSIAAQSATYLELSGPVVDPGNLQMNITFTDGRNASRILPFTLEWAEYLYGAPSAADAMGTIALERNRGGFNWVASDDFTSAVPSPLPASTWLLLSGLFFLVGVRRHTRG